jgi:uncharacterized protein YdhG (YjbR/CyaY superfamily)
MKKTTGNVKPKTVEEYLATVPEPARTTLEKVRKAIRAAAPAEATEKISWQMPSFYYKGALVCYAAFREHCSFFPMSAALLEELRPELAKYSTTKGTIHFPSDKPLPATIVRKIVKARVAANEGKGKR